VAPTRTPDEQQRFQERRELSEDPQLPAFADKLIPIIVE
jgi:hypothetical protein